jgi:hypothetical protein
VVASSRPEPGTAAYLTLRPAWSPDGPIAALDRPCEGWIDRAPVDPLEKTTFGRAIDWASEHAESAYVQGMDTTRGPALALFGEQAPDAEPLNGRSIEDALAVVDEGKERARAWDWYFIHQEGPWLADLRAQLQLTTEGLAELSGVPKEAISTFESVPEQQSLDSRQLAKIVHVLAGYPVPSDQDLERASGQAMSDSKPMCAGINLLLALHPDATLPPSPPFGTTPPRKELMKAVLDEVTPVLRSQGFKRQGLAFSEEPESSVLWYLNFQMGKGAPPSAWERKGHGPRFIPNYFFVNLGVHYDFAKPDASDEWTKFHAFRSGMPSTRLEAPGEFAHSSLQEWTLDNPGATGQELVRLLESDVAGWFSARGTQGVFSAMRKPFWFRILENRLVACRLACVQGDRELAQQLLDWAAMDRRERARDPDAARWLADRYGLVL